MVGNDDDDVAFLSSGHLTWQQFMLTSAIFNPTCGLAIPQLEFLANIFAFGQAEQFCILFFYGQLLYYTELYNCSQPPADLVKFDVNHSCTAALS